ncbi:hypothetical protein NDU88_004939 [Pleurodeles waltl]|uniref:Zona pellucida sperm-binding protein 1/4 Ig-like domain-containing protein n=1 Tax=Pleurodeles waltl TaxID=8319 RepID=A0AAV7UIH2_PLEWA|nr:hypothetical protein NDU88_004939 [Pleurodeles waltl]
MSEESKTWSSSALRKDRCETEKDIYGRAPAQDTTVFEGRRSQSHEELSVATICRKTLLCEAENDTDCRAWVPLRPDGSIVIGTDYTSCYMIEKDEVNAMAVEIKEFFATQNVSLEKHLNLPAVDAPSPVSLSVLPSPQ